MGRMEENAARTRSQKDEKTVKLCRKHRELTTISDVKASKIWRRK